MQTIQGASQEATSLHPPPADAFTPWGDVGRFVQQFHVNPPRHSFLRLPWADSFLYFNIEMKVLKVLFG